MSIPRQLAEKGALRLRRHEALKLTGRLFKLRRDVNLVSNVLDVPELFWSEASLKDLYSAVREYMEIRPRVEVLNEKLSVASAFVSCSIVYFCNMMRLMLMPPAGCHSRSFEQQRYGSDHMDRYLVCISFARLDSTFSN